MFFAVLDIEEERFLSGLERNVHHNSRGEEEEERWLGFIHRHSCLWWTRVLTFKALFGCGAKLAVSHLEQ